MNVSEIMAKNPITVHATDTMALAAKLLRDNPFRHLPVLDKNGKVVGIVTDRDLKRASASDATSLEVFELLYLLNKVKVSDIMTKNPATIQHNASMSEAAARMVEKRVGGLLVMDGEKLVGMITNSDFLRFLATGKAA